MELNALLSHKIRQSVSLCLCCFSLVTQAAVVGDGSPASCTQSILKAAVEQGGEVSFNCGAQPHIIYLTEEIFIDKDIVIDGGGLIILDGRSKNRIFKTLSDREPNMNINLRNLQLQYGYNHNEGGGAIHFGARTDVLMENVIFYKNEALRDRPQCDGGGGAFFLGYASTATIKNSRFLYNKANNGGAMAHLHSDLDVTDSLFEGNSATHTAFVGQYNDCSGGGAIYMDGARRDYDGGERWLKFRRVKFINNQVDHLGGAIYSHIYDTDNTLVEDCLFIGNQATGDWGGGAIWHNRADGQGYMYLNNSLIAHNRAHRSGGGIYADGPLSIRNTTLYKNMVLNPHVAEEDYRRGIGGAINLGNGSESQIFNSTIVENVAGYIAGGIIGGTTGNAQSAPLVANSIISNNISLRPDARQSCNQSLRDGGGNIQYPHGDKYRCFDHALSQDPRLDVLADYGGYYPSIALKSDSPAIGYSTPDYCPSIDQRAGTRKAQCDSGAFEFGNKLAFHHVTEAFEFDGNNLTASASRFNYRLSDDNGFSGNQLSANSHTRLSLSIDIKPTSADIGQTVQLFLLVMFADGQIRSLNQQGQWQLWDFNRMTLPMISAPMILPAQMSLDLLKQVLFPVGTYQVWFGYKRADTTLILPVKELSISIVKQ